MSGFALVIDRSGAPIEPPLAEAMSRALAFRAFDGTVAERTGAGLLVVATFLTPEVAGVAPSPGVVKLGDLRVAGDVRLDGRDDLVSALRAAGSPARATMSHLELVAHAVQVWGDGCAERLLGDFAFVAWDAVRGRVLAVRDQLGIRPLFHAVAGERLIVTNTLDAALALPGLPDTLDEAAVAELLAVGALLDTAHTVFAAVHAVPPAHVIVANAGDVRLRRYWTLPLDGELRHRRVRDYAEHFDEVFTRAVADRTPDAPVAIRLSGGRDSTAIAATVQALTRSGSRAAVLRAVTIGYDRLMPDREHHLAAVAARSLELGIDVLPADDFRVLEGLRDGSLRGVMPMMEPMAAAQAALRRRAAAHGRVVLDGSGGDAVQRESASRLAGLLSAGRLGAALGEAITYARWHRRLPRPGFRAAYAARRRGSLRVVPPVPGWLQPDLVTRTGLGDRLAAIAAPSDHPRRPEAHALVLSAIWPWVALREDAGMTGLPVETRYPFLDLRLVRFLLSVPPAQWYNDKGLLRITMRGRLPDAIVFRDKAPLVGDPVEAALRHGGANWLGGARVSPVMDPYVRRDAIPRLFGGTGTVALGPSSTINPLLLSLWIENRA